MAENSVGIEITVKGGANFKSALTTIQKPVEKLNAALTTLTKTLNDFGGGLGRIQKGALSGLATELTALSKSAQTLRGGNLSGIRSAASAIQTMMRLLNDPANQLAGNVAQRVVRWQQFRRLLRSLANALKTFDRIKKPQNIAAAATGVSALRRVLVLLNEPKFKESFEAVTRSTIFRNTVWRQLQNMAKHIANALKSFDRLKRPQNISAAATAINALSRLLLALSKISDENQKLARGGAAGLFSQKGFLAEGLSKFITVIANAIRAFGKLPRGTGTNVRNVASFIRSISQLMTQLSGSIGVQGLKETAKELDSFITSLARSIRKFGGIPRINAGGFDRLFKGFLNFRKQGDLGKLDKDIGKSAGNIVATLTSMPGKLLSGFVNPFKRLFTGLGSGVLTFGRTVTEGVQAALRGIAGLSGPVLRLARNAGQQIAKVIGNAIKLGLNTLRFGRNLFQGVVDQARRAGQEIARSFQATGRQLQQIGRSFTQAGLGLLVGGGLAGAIQGRQVSLVADFESLLKQIEVLGGVTGDSLEKSNKFILDLGESSVFSASEVAAAFLDLVKSGLDVEDTMATLPAIMDLAAAGQIGVADASSLAIAAIKSFNLEFEDSARVADAFVAAANVGTAEVNDLAGAFPFAASQANAFGQELETTLAAITLLIDTGQPASNAGRGLASLFTALIDPSEDAKGALDDLQETFEAFLPTELGGTGQFALTAAEIDELGLSMSDLAQIEDTTLDFISDADGNFRDLDQIIALLSISTRELDEDQRALALTTVAGSQNAGRVLLSLVNAFENGQGSIADYEEAMRNSTSAQEVGAALMDTFQGSVEELSGAFETLLIKGLTPVIEYGLRPLVDGITVVIRTISSLPDEVLALASAAVLLGTALATVAGAFLLITGLNLQLLGVALTVIGGAISALVNPLRAIIVLTGGQGVIAAMFGSAVFLIPLITTVVAAFAIIGRAIRSEGVQGAISNLSENFDLLQESIKSLLGPLYELARVVLGAVLSPAVDSVSVALENLILSINGVVVKARGVIEPLSQALTDILGFLGIGASIATGDSIDVRDFPVIDAAFRAKEALEEAKNALDFDPFEVFTLIDPERALDFDWGTASFDEMREFLINNSLNWNEDIGTLRDIWADAKKTLNVLPEGVGVLNFLPGDVTSAALQTTTASFETLSELFSGLAKNEFFRWLFGDQVTGIDLAFVFVGLLAWAEQVRDVFQFLTDSIAEFFDALREGIPVGEALGELIADIVATSLKLTGLGLSGLEIAFGFDTQGLSQLLQEGSLGAVIEEFGERILIAMIEKSISILGSVAGVFADIFDTLFGTNIAPIVDRFFEILQDGVAPFFGFIQSLTAFVRGPVSRNFLKFIGLLARQVPIIREALNDVVHLFEVFQRMIDQVGAQQATVNMATLLFGPNATDDAEFVIDLLWELSDSVAFAFEQIRDVLRGDISVGEFLETFATGVLDDLRSLGQFAWDEAIKPFIAGLTSALRGVDWAAVWAVVRNGLTEAATFAGDQIKIAWSKILEFANDVDWDQVWRDVQDGADFVFEKVQVSWESILEFVGLTELRDQITDDVGLIIEDLRPLTDFLSSGFSLATSVAVLALALSFKVLSTVFSVDFVGIAKGIGDIAGAIANLSAKVLDAPITLISSLFTNLKEAVESLQELNFGVVAIGLTLVAIAFGPMIATAFTSGLALLAANLALVSASLMAFVLGTLAPVAAGIAIVAAALVILNGVLNAVPAVVDFFNALAEGDFEGAAVALGDVFFLLAEGILEGSAAIADFLLTLVGKPDAVDDLIESVQNFIEVFEELGGFRLIITQLEISFLKLFRTVLSVLQRFEEATGVDFGLEDNFEDIALRIQELEEEQITIKIGATLSGQVAEGGGFDLLQNLLTGESFVGQTFSGLSQESRDAISDQYWAAINEVLAGILDDPDIATDSNTFEQLFLLLIESGSGTLPPATVALLENTYGKAWIDGLLLAVQNAGEGQDIGSQGEAFEAIGAAAQEYFNNNPVDIELPLSLTPSEDEAETSETVTEDIADGYQNIADTATEAANTAVEESGRIVLSQEDMSNATDAMKLAMSGDLVEVENQIKSLSSTSDVQFKAIVNSMLSGERAVDSLHTKVVSKSALIKTELLLMRTAWVNEFNIMRQSVVDLAATLGGLTGNYAINITPGTTPTTPPPGRASGGSVFAGNLYEVAEQGMSELLRIGGNTYLIPGENGLVIPAQTATPYSQDTSALGLRGGVGGGYVDQSMVINEGDVTVTVSGAGGDVNDIASDVRAQIDAANAERNRELASRLRAAGRG